MVGDKWSLLIIRDILFSNKSSYGDFLNSTEGISTNILANRLKNMVERGLLVKTVDPANRQKNIYSATPKSEALKPIIEELAKWSNTWLEATDVLPGMERQMQAVHNAGQMENGYSNGYSAEQRFSNGHNGNGHSSNGHSHSQNGHSNGQDHVNGQGNLAANA